MKYSGIGGQAVIEGVMMRNEDNVAVAIRMPDKTINIKKDVKPSIRKKYKALDIPIVRGIVAFVESLISGMGMLNYSASFFEEEEEKTTSKTGQNILMALTTVLAIIVAIGLFVALPFFTVEALKKYVTSMQVRGLIEGVIRVILFIIYVFAIRAMQDIKRVFMYHGAEHKSINCIEHGDELTVENVRKHSTLHKRCGTSFLLVVMLISILFFMIIVVDKMWLRMVLRIVLIPLIAGISYEFIRFAGKYDNAVVNVLSKPGLCLQKLTTLEPTDDMIEVAIASVDSVFDWKEFVKTVNETDEPAKESEEKADEPAKESEEKLDEPAKESEEEKADESAEHEDKIEIVSLDDDEPDEFEDTLVEIMIEGKKDDK